VLDRLGDPPAGSIRETVGRNVNANEQAASLTHTLADAKRELLRLFLPPAPPTQPDRDVKSPPPVPVRKQVVRRTVRGRPDTVLEAVREFAEQHPGSELEVEIRTLDEGEH